MQKVSVLITKITIDCFPGLFQTYVCSSGLSCVIKPVTKGSKSCGFCRFQKCLSVAMKPEMVQHSIRELSKENRQKLYCKRVKVYDSFFQNRFQQKCSHIFDKKDTSNDESKSSDETSLKCKKLVQMSCWRPVVSPITCPKRPIFWVKKLWSSPMPQELLKFQLVDTYYKACDSFKLTLNIYLDPESDADHQLLQSLMIPSFKNNETVTSHCDSTSLYLQTNNNLITFDREALSVFNVHVTTISKEESSIIIMESLNDDHWTRFKDIISFARILHRFTYVDHEVTINHDSIDQMFDDLNEPRYTCTLFSSVVRACSIISKAIESLSFFSNLSTEDQFIILKDCFYPIDWLIFNNIYDDEAESYVFTALNGRLSYCCHRDRLKIYSSNQYTDKLDQFYKFLLDKFLAFLRTDFFFISILSILCVLQDNSGLSCTDLLERERKYYCEILDAYIRAKVISNEWLSDVDVIWRNIHEIFYELSKYPSILKPFIKEQQRIKNNF